jgi:hypothetical protein
MKTGASAPVFLAPWMARMPEMQEHFPAGASMAPLSVLDGVYAGDAEIECRPAASRHPACSSAAARDALQGIA